MAKVLLSEEILQDTANSLRAKLNSEDKIKPSEFASKLDSLSVAEPIEKGLIPRKYNENGFPTEAELVGMTSVPNYYAASQYVNAEFFTKVTTLILPSDLVSIGIESFLGWKMLTKMDLPATITSIGKDAINGCGALTTLIIRAITPPTLDTQLGANNPIYGKRDGYIYVPDESVDAYKTATNWSQYESQIKPLSELEVTE